MKPIFEAKQKLQNAIEKHFPSVETQKARQWANEIYESADTAAALQWIERSDTRPDKDRLAMQKAAQHLRKASKALESVGWYGMGELEEMGVRAYKTQHEYARQHTPALPRNEAVGALTGLLSSMAEEIEVASKNIDPHSPSVMSAFEPEGPHEPSTGKPPGRPLETTALYTAREVYNAFADLSGNRPTVSTNPHGTGNPAYGPFLDLLSKVFSCLDLATSPETWARHVCKENTPQKD